MADIHVTDDKALDIAAGLLAAARGRLDEDQNVMVAAACKLAGDVHLHILHRRLNDLAKGADKQDKASAKSPVDLATLARRDMSDAAKRGWATRRANARRGKAKRVVRKRIRR